MLAVLGTCWFLIVHPVPVWSLYEQTPNMESLWVPGQVCIFLHYMNVCSIHVARLLYTIYMHIHIYLPISLSISMYNIYIYIYTSGWWFGTCFMFPYVGSNTPNWLIFFRGVETTNQYIYIYAFTIFIHALHAHIRLLLFEKSLGASDWTSKVLEKSWLLGCSRSNTFAPQSPVVF